MIDDGHEEPHRSEKKTTRFFQDLGEQEAVTLGFTMSFVSTSSVDLPLCRFVIVTTTTARKLQIRDASMIPGSSSLLGVHITLNGAA